MVGTGDVILHYSYWSVNHKSKLCIVAVFSQAMPLQRIHVGSYLLVSMWEGWVDQWFVLWAIALLCCCYIEA